MDKLVSPRKTAEIIKTYDLRLNKRYGQNFLIDENILLKIIESSELKAQDNVLEVGPGIGTLTQVLSPRVSQVLAVEIDKRLISVLEKTLASYKNISIVQGDILKIDLKNLTASHWGEGKFKVISNLPYSITTPFISKILRERHNIDFMILMVQKEAAERVIAQPGSKNYGALAVFVKTYGETKILFKVSRRVFLPCPEVESAVIKLKIRDEPLYEVEDEELFYKIVRGSFQYRRKSIFNSLRTAFKIDRAELDLFLRKAKIKPSCRAEMITAAGFAKLSNIIYNSIK